MGRCEGGRGARRREIALTGEDVAQLIAARFPQWAGLTVTPFPSTGTDNLIFRLGVEMLVRVPRNDRAAEKIAREFRALTGFGPLPSETPGPLALATDAAGRCYSVCRWIEGSVPTTGEIAGSHEAAALLGRFVSALRHVPTFEGPKAGDGNEYRGTNLSGRHRAVLASIAALKGEIDTKAASQAWIRAMIVPPSSDRPRWLHGDLHPGNLIVRDGQLVGVIDFGLAAVGDAAADLAAGWMVFDASARPAFRDAAGLDDASWARGRGWALYQGLIALAYYRDRNPPLAAIARAAVDRVLADPP